MNKKREEFEKAKWKTNAIDMMPENPLADPKCKLCNGHGLVDLGFDTGCILGNCPECWK